MILNSDALDRPVSPIEIDSKTLRAARRFLDKVEARYPVRDAFLFGSRARGTHRPDSDADIAVVMRGEVGRRGPAIIDMASMAFDVMMDCDVLVEAIPLWEGEFDHPEGRASFYLVRNIRRDGIRL